MNKLRNRNIKNDSFIESFRFVKVASYYGSWTANILDIVFMFFILYPTTLKMVGIENKLLKAMIFGVTAILLCLFEVTKRTLIYESTYNFFVNKESVKFKIMTFSSVLIIAMTSYMAILGVQELSNRKDEIKTKTEDTYSLKKNKIDEEYKSEKAEIKKRYDNLLSSANQWFAPGINKDLNKELENLELRHSKNLDEIKSEKVSVSESSITDNEDIITKSIGYSLLIELVIIFGMIFNCKYDYEEIVQEEKTETEKRIAEELKKKKMLASEEYKSYKNDCMVVEALYQFYKGNSTLLPQYNKLKPAIDKKVNFSFKKKDFDFFKEFLKQKEILSSEGARNRFLKNLKEAKLVLKSHYELDDFEI